MSEQREISAMAWDVLIEAQAWSWALTAASDRYGYDALRQLAPLISCWQYGHPDQPTHRLRRWQRRPWRCTRCGTWWVTERLGGDSGGAWQWARVERC